MPPPRDGRVRIGLVQRREVVTVCHVGLEHARRLVASCDEAPDVLRAQGDGVASLVVADMRVGDARDEYDETASFLRVRRDAAVASIQFGPSLESLDLQAEAAVVSVECVVTGSAERAPWPVAGRLDRCV